MTEITRKLGVSEQTFYLTELERHAGALSANLQNWTPWNYRNRLAATGPPHNVAR